MITHKPARETITPLRSDEGECGAVLLNLFAGFIYRKIDRQNCIRYMRVGCICGGLARTRVCVCVSLTAADISAID